MASRTTAVLTTLGLAVGGVATAAPAHAVERCTITNFSPRSVVVGLSPIVRTFGVSTTGCTKEGWEAHAADYSWAAFDGDDQYIFEPYGFMNSDAGAKTVVTSADSSDYVTTNRVFTGGFSLKRRTAWQSRSFDASPEPVKRGRNITIKARLLIANWSSDRYDGYGARTIAIQFRTPTGSYSTVKTATTASNGWVTTTVPAKQTGVWRVNYGGNSYAGSAVVVGDAVTVTP